MSEVKVTKLPVPCLYLGEGPHWEEDKEALLYVDIFNKSVCRYFVNTKRLQVLRIDDGGKAKTVTMVVPVEGIKDWYVVSVGNTLCGLHWKVSDPDQHTVKPKVIQVTQDSHFNDGKCDPQGRLWAGTMGPQDDDGELLTWGTAGVYRLDADLSWHKCIDKVSASNGLIWSPDRKKLFYIDSEAFSVDVFSYDDASGVAGDRVVLLDYKKSNLGEDIPDGMTRDVEGNLWVANFKGSKVICVHPVTGKVTRQVNLPSKNITSMCWGGPDYSTLFVTSAKMRLTPQEVKEIPDAGATFAVTGLGAKGCRANSFRPDLKLFKEKMGL